MWFSRQEWNANSLDPLLRCPAYRAKLNELTCTLAADGTEFKIVTEKQLRGPILDNVKFLLPYRQRQFDPACREMLEQLLVKPARVERVLERLQSKSMPRESVLPLVWHAIAEGWATVKLEQKLSGKSLMTWGGQVYELL